MRTLIVGAILLICINASTQRPLVKHSLYNNKYMPVNPEVLKQMLEQFKNALEWPHDIEDRECRATLGALSIKIDDLFNHKHTSQEQASLLFLILSRGSVAYETCKPVFEYIFSRYGSETNRSVGCEAALVDAFNATTLFYLDSVSLDFKYAPIYTVRLWSSLQHLVNRCSNVPDFDIYDTARRMISIVRTLPLPELCPEVLNDYLMWFVDITQHHGERDVVVPILQRIISHTSIVHDRCMPWDPTSEDMKREFTELSKIVPQLYERVIRLMDPLPPFVPRHIIDERWCFSNLTQVWEDIEYANRTMTLAERATHYIKTSEDGRLSSFVCRNLYLEVLTQYAEEKNTTVACSNAIIDFFNGSFSIYKAFDSKTVERLPLPFTTILATGYHLIDRCESELTQHLERIVDYVLLKLSVTSDCVGRASRLVIQTRDIADHIDDLNYVLPKIAFLIIDGQQFFHICLNRTTMEILLASQMSFPEEQEYLIEAYPVYEAVSYEEETDFVEETDCNSQIQKLIERASAAKDFEEVMSVLNEGVEGECDLTESLNTFWKSRKQEQQPVQVFIGKFLRGLDREY